MCPPTSLPPCIGHQERVSEGLQRSCGRVLPTLPFWPLHQVKNPELANSIWTRRVRPFTCNCTVYTAFMNPWQLSFIKRCSFIQSVLYRYVPMQEAEEMVCSGTAIATHHRTEQATMDYRQGTFRCT